MRLDMYMYQGHSHVLFHRGKETRCIGDPKTSLLSAVF